MSTNVYMMKVSFASHTIWAGNDIKLDQNHDLAPIFLIECYINGEFDWQDEDQEYPLNSFISFGGWKYIGFADNEVSSNIWEKDNYTIHMVNESQYRNGGDFQMKVFGEDQKAIEEFCKDHNFECKINKDVIVQAWY